ncbi:MAG: coproporphyrinogen III oxidase family protein [Candidatus Portnoybacteria bacterium]|nr:coproporphyrinogen III oxidase family protein [Candidatus Portnoybacteria bacterium]
MDIYRNLVNYCRIKNPARCWFDYPPTYLLSRKIDFKDIKKSVYRLINSKEKYGLYVNIPFCKTRCAYCMYYSEVIPKSDVEKKVDIYLDALAREIESYNINFKKRKTRHLYIGGGTPLLLNPKQLKRLFEIIYKNFVFTSTSQFTIEGRPGDFTQEKLEILVKNKINRVTLGIQSFDEDTLRRVGRNCTVKEIYDAFKEVRRAGIKYINTDIIVGLPGESKKKYQKTINHLLKLSPECISCTRILYGQRVNIPKKDQVLDKALDRDYSFFDEIFRQNNYLPIENKEGVYLKGGLLEANNKLLFDNLNYSAYILGIGARAISYLSDVRYATNKVDDYIGAFENSKNTNYYGMFLDKDDSMRQYIILQLYLLQKIKLKDFSDKFKTDLLKVYKKEIDDLEKNDLIKIDRDAGLIALLDKNIDLKDFFYNMLKYLYKRDYLDKIIKMALARE